MSEHVHVFTYGSNRCSGCNEYKRVCWTITPEGPHQWGPPRHYHADNLTSDRMFCHGCGLAENRANDCDHAVDFSAAPDVVDQLGNWHWCTKCQKTLVSKPFGHDFPLVVENISPRRNDYPKGAVKRLAADAELTPGFWTLDEKGVYLRCIRVGCGRLLDISKSLGGRICVMCSHCDGHYFVVLEGETHEDFVQMNRIQGTVYARRIPR